MIRHGLHLTAALWPPIEAAYAFVHRAAHVLANHEHTAGLGVQQADEALLAEVAAQQVDLGSLAPAAAHFRKVTASSWSGLFTCYDVPNLPRTNNDLEQYFGTARHLERRATGRKGASPAVVVRGAVRVVAAVATHMQPVTPQQLQPTNLTAWKALRAQVEARHAARRVQARFRRNPIAYLAALEEQLLRPALPT